MDQPIVLIVCSVLAVLLACYCCLYIALILMSPSPPLALPSEKTYRSAQSPDKPNALPRLVDSEGTVDLSVIVPAFNEVDRLPSMLETTINHLSSPACAGRSYEIIIVDDGSTDTTSSLALELAQNKYKRSDIRVVTLENNLGKGGAVRHGMLHTRGRRLLMVDADGASRFEDLELLWKAMDEVASDGRDAMAVGSRAHLVKTDAVVKRSVLRNAAMYALHVVLRAVGVGHVRDTQCGFKLFTRGAAQRIFPYQHVTGWIFDVELILLAKQQRIPLVEVPITWHEVPESKLKVARDSLLMFRDLMLLRLNHLSGRWKVPTASKEE